ncbi:hypothetical protein B0A63_18900 [Flavobacterium johnsoniae UW101]|nr:hypothetical protein B0A63_18900 [Flavobacterium johnsoniae UW101]
MKHFWDYVLISISQITKAYLRQMNLENYLNTSFYKIVITKQFKSKKRMIISDDAKSFCAIVVHF